MNRRKLLAFGAAVAAAAPLAACGSDDDGAESGPVELTISVWNMDSTPEFKALFDAFQKANTDITIKPVDILADDYPTKVTTMLAGGDSTDVITMKNVIDYARYAGRGQLKDVTSLAKSENGAKLNGLDAFKQEGDKYYALPYRQDFWVLYYNKKLFDAAGKPYPTNLTWDQYADLAKALTGGAGQNKVYGTYHHTWRSVVQAISAAQTGGNLLGPDYKFFGDQYKNALGIQEAGATLDYGTAKTQKTGYASMFETKKTAMLPMGTWYIAKIMAEKKKGSTDADWAIAPLPQAAGASGVTTFGSPTAFAVNKNAKHAAAAQKFVEFAAGPEGAKAIAAIGVVPALLTDEIRTSYFGLEGMPTDDTSKKAFAPDKIVLEMPVSDKTSKIDTILNEEHGLIMTKEKSVDAGIAEIEKRVKNEAS
ncbi:multiple sugar transport system substrate-binding protein [Hamadaea flava]|uniref:ABC transporter substrate-binding protein n=1 Tax=Hamadaea flava TaxID=1742688 RepID=A0ABV8M161_9ACTN|nr:extracellular solute-binding protein [Hamadaea flava]MCP2322004.1 multiple sugar transport system substrate-binding protein [Hamadaea flava]